MKGRDDGRFGGRRAKRWLYDAALVFALAATCFLTLRAWSEGGPAAAATTLGVIGGSALLTGFMARRLRRGDDD